MAVEHVHSPWHFLASLGANSVTDRELIQLTRSEELWVAIDMVAASRVSILYAYSGNGKSSLINAGLVPFFDSQGWATFRTRPRPPWSIENPLQAFKDCILRELDVPAFNEADFELLQALKGKLAGVPGGSQKDFTQLFEKFEHSMARETTRGTEYKDVHTRLRDYVHRPLNEFLQRLQDLAGGDRRLVFICDQFEELFVHYANTPQLEELVAALGESWADDSLNMHLLFSMREEWVGSMIAFRKTIPDVFSNYFKLNPLQRSRSSEILRLPLTHRGLSIEDETVGRILDDLADWGMHLTPEAPRSSIRALEDYSRTLGSFKSASPSGFKVNRCRPPAGRNERRL